MHWLTGLLAFAVTMLIFAMIVSSLVETIHRVWRMRAKGLQMMLESLYEQVIEPRLAEHDPTVSAEKFAQTIMLNRSVVRLNRTGGPVGRLLNKFLDSSAVSHMTVEVFMQKLADTRLLESALEAGHKLNEDVLKDIAQKFESYGDEVGIYFERRARLFSIVVAFFVAWMFYVHPYNLLSTYINNPQLAALVADRSNETVQDYSALTEKLDKTLANSQLSVDDAAQLTAAVAALKYEITQGHDTVNTLSSIGVSVGWSTEGTERRCFLDSKTKDSADHCKIWFLNMPSIANALWLLFGGLLVGLGAPFWARAVSSLARSRDLTNRIAAAVNDADVASSVVKGPSAVVSEVASNQDSNLVVNAFNVAASARGNAVR